MEIVGSVKNYEWGKLGGQSVVAQLAKLNAQDFSVSETVTYAELWMGDHESGPATIKSNGKLLGTQLSNRLPFLLKVLSINKALSIQVHPNKLEAERLHKTRPDIYRDPNHKPELAIALTPFLALCGFRPYGEIYRFITDLPVLESVIGGGENIDALRRGTAEGLRRCYANLMVSNSAKVNHCIDQISRNHQKVLAENNLLETFNTISRDFPNDVGVLSLFFLNLVRLQPGEAIFLGANEIHAYLSGDCVECMACSDNVIRAGLTPKYKDVTQLIASLNYVGLPPSTKLFKPRCIDKNVEVFAPPVQDFAVTKICLTTNQQYCLNLQTHAAILLVLEGECTLQLREHNDLHLKRGSIVYIPAEVSNEIKFSSEGNDNFIGYIATENYCYNTA